MPIRSKARWLAKEQIDRKHGVDLDVIVSGLSYLFPDRVRSELHQVAVEATDELRAKSENSLHAKIID